MAHMSKKGEWFVARFTWNDKEYKKSLKTRDEGDANRVADLLDTATIWVDRRKLSNIGHSSGCVSKQSR